jgi:hypothetical protein
VLRATNSPLLKEQVKTDSKKEKDSKKQVKIEEAKTTLQTHSFELAQKDFCLPRFEEKFFLVLKTASKHLDHKNLFTNRYFLTILRHFISPQAP